MNKSKKTYTANTLTFSQKGTLLALIILFVLCISWIPKLALPIFYLISILLILLVAIGFLFAVICHKKGFLKNDDGLYVAYFIFGLTLHKSLIDLTNYSDISILKSRKKMAFEKGHRMEPDMVYYDFFYNIFLLNEPHTLKFKLISTTNEQKAKEMIDFLTINSHLKSKNYMPRF